MLFYFVSIAWGSLQFDGLFLLVLLRELESRTL